MFDLSPRFERYPAHYAAVPAWYVTPLGLTSCIHRFYDSSPVSPSGRYLALTRLPSEERPPLPGENADIIVVDLATAEWSAVGRSRGFDTQLGAQVQWGRDDTELYYNDMDTEEWRPFCVRTNPLTGERTEFVRPVYSISPDGEFMASPCLLRIALTQPGYGVIAPAHRIPLNASADPADGLWVTSLRDGQSRLVLSLEKITESIDEIRSDMRAINGTLFGFHVKWSPQGDRLMFIVRLRCRGERTKRRLNYVLTLRPDGTDLQMALPGRIWAKGGHHPNWFPDGKNIVQNLNPFGDGLRFCAYHYSGTELRCLSRTIRGGGHPTIHRSGTHLLTDAYLKEPVAYGDGSVPIRWIDLRTQTEEALLRVQSAPQYVGISRELRVDPHPAWDRTGQRIVFNCTEQGRRRVGMADLSTRVAPGQ
jgi:hypothetical protein